MISVESDDFDFFCFIGLKISSVIRWLNRFLIDSSCEQELSRLIALMINFKEGLSMVSHQYC